MSNIYVQEPHTKPTHDCTTISYAFLSAAKSSSIPPRVTSTSNYGPRRPRKPAAILSSYVSRVTSRTQYSTGLFLDLLFKVVIRPAPGRVRLLLLELVLSDGVRSSLPNLASPPD
ncbi:hypothetical protein BC936DRAFT_145411 [Jimgerdemannia flammicorona]|uniref:Uncharacterized protein n=1 Tax=Jimgerdemannia flammicorona TaxID=994334 RepID=A0A433DLS2_9FUNG|nr:hypothetical protein BC936DRAFT_145411 [Jimgerdemannia flammicorona]